MAKKLMGEGWLSLAYVNRYPDSKRIDRWVPRRVHIQSENGIWRPGGNGYTTDRAQAGVWFFDDAVRRTSHCGPEKCVRYIDAEHAT